MLYDDRLSKFHINQQKQFKAEYDQEAQLEWIERREDQPDAVVHGRYLHSYGIVKMRCAQCGSAFYCQTESYHNGRKYCSERCVNDAYVAKRNVRRIAAREKVCPVCGKGFQARRKDSVYCSSACRQNQYRQNKHRIQSNDV